MKNMNVTIPENMVEQLQDFLATLNVQQSTSSSAPSESTTQQIEHRDRCEVVKVKTHKVDKDGNFSFRVIWKGGSTGWVSDEECDCEYLINEYLKTKNIITAYLFCRVSTSDQAKSTNLSLDAQKDELLKALKELGITYQRIRIYQISGSAYRSIPRQLQDIGSSASVGDAILVWRVDRLSRNIEQSMEWLRELDKKGVVIYSHQEKLQFAENKLMFYQALLDAQKEANLLGERVKLALRRKKERGDYIGGLKYGKKYKRLLNSDGTTQKMVVVDDPVEQSLIKSIKRSKDTFASQADNLNRRGITKRGRKWTRNMVRSLVTKE